MPDARLRSRSGARERRAGTHACPDAPAQAAPPALLVSQLQLIDANLLATLIGGCLTAFCLVWLVWLQNPVPSFGRWQDAAAHFIAWLAPGGAPETASAAGEHAALPRMRSAAWLVAYVLGALGCWSAWRHVWRRTPALCSPEQSYRVIQRLALMSGALWGLGFLWLFQPESSAVILGMVCLQGGLSGGVLSGIGVRARLYWLVCLPMGLGLLGAFLYHGSEVNPVLPLALLVLLVSNGFFAHNIERHIGSAIELRFENLALVEQLRERTDAAEQANLAKSKFLAGASHDLRQPVHALNLFLESLSTTALDAKQETIVNHAKAASRASRELLDTLLDFSRIEAGVMQPKPAVVPMAGLLRQLEDEFGPQADNKGLVYRSRDCLDHVYSDAALLLVILRNLVANAIRYTERGGVLVAVRSRAGDRVIEVWDTGIGIAAMHHQAIFEDFHQIGNQERDHRKGLGLGLAIVRRLVDTLGLELRLASRPGQGSVFSLRLPPPPNAAQLAEAAALQPPPSPGNAFQRRLTLFAPLAQLPANARPLQGLRVLLVDDEVMVLEGMRALLGAWGCVVMAFRDIAGATGHVHSFEKDGPPFDLLITDYRLENGVTGGDVIRAVHAALRRARPHSTFVPPGIIITGDTDPARIVQAQSVGATLLHKPIAAQVLYEELAKVLALRQNPATHA